MSRRSMAAATFGALVAVLLTAPTAADARVVGPETTSGYRVIGEGEAGTPAYDWVDTSGGEVLLNHVDDAEAGFALQFPIFALNNVVTSVTVSSNGYVSFGPESAEAPDATSAAPRRLVGYGADLVDSTVTTAVVGTAPHRRTAITWQASTVNGGDALFQLVIREDSSDLVLQYASIEGAVALDAGRVALTNGGQPSLVWSADGSDLSNGDVVDFTMDDVLSVPEQGLMFGEWNKVADLNLPAGASGSLTVRLEGPPGFTAADVLQGGIPGFAGTSYSITGSGGVVTFTASFSSSASGPSFVLVRLSEEVAQGPLTVTAALSTYPRRALASRTTTIGLQAPPTVKNCHVAPSDQHGDVSFMLLADHWQLTGYTLRAHPTDAGDSSEDAVLESQGGGTFTGLDNLREYAVTVTAHNAAGESVTPCGTLVPSKVPLPPDVSALPDPVPSPTGYNYYRSVILTLSDPGTPETSAPTSYRAEFAVLGAPELSISNPGATTDTWVFDTNIGTQTVRLQACNASGCSEWSAWSDPFTIAPLPTNGIEAGGWPGMAPGELAIHAQSTGPFPYEGCERFSLYAGDTTDPSALLQTTADGWSLGGSGLLVDGADYTVAHRYCDAGDPTTVSPSVDLLLHGTQTVPDWATQIIDLGDTVVLSGGSGVADGEYLIFSRPSGTSEWTYVDPQPIPLADVDGHFESLPLSPTANTDYLVSFIGATGFLGSSAEMQVSVRPDLGAELTDGTIAPRLMTAARGLPSTSKIYGKTSKGLAGEKLALQRMVDGSWTSTGSTVAVKKQTLPDGRTTVGYKLALSPSKAGKYKYRVRFKGSEVYAAAASPSVVLTVR